MALESLKAFAKARKNNPCPVTPHRISASFMTPSAAEFVLEEMADRALCASPDLPQAFGQKLNTVDGSCAGGVAMDASPGTALSTGVGPLPTPPVVDSTLNMLKASVAEFVSENSRSPTRVGERVCTRPPTAVGGDAAAGVLSSPQHFPAVKQEPCSLVRSFGGSTQGAAVCASSELRHRPMSSRKPAVRAVVQCVQQERLPSGEVKYRHIGKKENSDKGAVSSDDEVCEMDFRTPTGSPPLTDASSALPSPAPTNLSVDDLETLTRIADSPTLFSSESEDSLPPPSSFHSPARKKQQEGLSPPALANSLAAVSLAAVPNEQDVAPMHPATALCTKRKNTRLCPPPHGRSAPRTSQTLPAPSHAELLAELEKMETGILPSQSCGAESEVHGIHLAVCVCVISQP